MELWHLLNLREIPHGCNTFLIYAQKLNVICRGLLCERRVGVHYKRFASEFSLFRSRITANDSLNVDVVCACALSPLHFLICLQSIIIDFDKSRMQIVNNWLLFAWYGTIQLSCILSAHKADTTHSIFAYIVPYILYIASRVDRRAIQRISTTNVVRKKHCSHLYTVCRTGPTLESLTSTVAICEAAFFTCEYLCHNRMTCDSSGSGSQRWHAHSRKCYPHFFLATPRIGLWFVWIVIEVAARLLFEIVIPCGRQPGNLSINVIWVFWWKHPYCEYRSYSDGRKNPRSRHQVNVRAWISQCVKFLGK